MNRSTWRGVLAALFVIFCLGADATEPVLQLAFLRPAPQIPKEDEPPPPTPIARDQVARSILREGSFYDPTNPDLRHLQSYEDAMSSLPMDANGFPDWVRALRELKIQPQASLDPTASSNVLSLDIVMKNTREMPFVRFPHYTHTLWLDCSNCHPAPFEPRAGATPITMTEIFRGRYCGMCHDRVAFITFLSCQRCHSEPQPGGIALPR